MKDERRGGETGEEEGDEDVEGFIRAMVFGLGLGFVFGRERFPLGVILLGMESAAGSIYVAAIYLRRLWSIVCSPPTVCHFALGSRCSMTGGTVKINYMASMICRDLIGKVDI